MTSMKAFILVFLLLLVNDLTAQEVHSIKQEERWVDSVYRSLSEEERLGQLFMVAAYSNKGSSYQQDLGKLVKRYNIGGLLFMQGGPVRQARLTNLYQAMAKTPMLIAMDAEWGLGMRLDSTISYPRQMTLGAISDDHQIFLMGAEIGRQLNRLGVHINFAPVIDVNSNPANPVIGTRSFGEDLDNVAAKGIAYMKGLESQGVMANAKHFPGHGDTSADSHYTLPIIAHSRTRLEQVELYPFKKLIDAGLRSTMIAHLYIPALDSTVNLPSTLSQPVVTGLLKEQLGFSGLVFTDALNMKGVTKYYEPGVLELMALQAGNDVLLFPENVPLAIQALQQAIKDKQLKKSLVESRVRKILTTKYRSGLNNYQPVNLDNLHFYLNRPEAQLLKQNLFEKSITVVNNRDKIIPTKVLDTTYFASLIIGSTDHNTFQKKLSKYASFNHFTISNRERNKAKYQTLLGKLENFNQVVIGLHTFTKGRSSQYGLTNMDIEFLRELQKRTKIIVVAFGNPYSMEYLQDIDNLICAYQDQTLTQELVPQIIFGALPASGRLPVSAGAIPAGTGETTEALGRLGYSIPEDAGMDSKVLGRIDRIVNEAISEKATPGCQVLVARNGKVVFEKSYGYFSYDSINAVTEETLYDIASITKVVATLQAIMFLKEQGAIDLNKKVSFYLPELNESNKNNIYVKDLLTHQAGLLPFIPFWRRTVDEVGLNPTIYSAYPEQNFQMQVALGMYSIRSLQDSLWQWTVDSRLRPNRYRRGSHYTYKYSDMGFYILKKLAESHLNQPIEQFLEQNFYHPLGLSTMTYLPLCKFPINRIAPTEEDNYFRNTLICGTVHDQGAAMFGGIAGHAGIFSNATDLAIMAQMNLQDGYYGGTRYLQQGTLSEFTGQQSPQNRRGLGWDKPERNGKINPTSRYASPATFGHTGFTGTAVWVDPEFDLVYVFLSNRIHPKANNTKLIKSNIRTRIQDAIYDSMWSYRKGNSS
ncbi:MAG: beta-N-acetylglucosaminidase [Cyclobacteriaceae bacterium]|nr:MAG: beta-N-acetylglucosaminidase [Cyclobacteriaceae bacterium]